MEDELETLLCQQAALCERRNQLEMKCTMQQDVIDGCQKRQDEAEKLRNVDDALANRILTLEAQVDRQRTELERLK